MSILQKQISLPHLVGDGHIWDKTNHLQEADENEMEVHCVKSSVIID